MKVRPGSSFFMFIVVVAALATGGATGYWLRSLPQKSLEAPPALDLKEHNSRGSGAAGTPSGVAGSAHTSGGSAPAPILLPAPGPETKSAPGTGDALDRFADVAQAVTPAVVTILSRRKIPPNEKLYRWFGSQDPLVRSHGSGFIVESNGIILTNSHVVEDAESLTVRLMDGREFDAKVLGHDEQTDIAVLHIDATGLPSARLGDSDRVRVGEWVLAIGSPFRASLGNTVTTGIISGKGRDDVALADYEEFLQTDAAVNPGNSGGPLINMQSQVIGINTAIATQSGSFQGVSFAIPVNLARVIAERLLQEGHVTRGWLGVSIGPLTSSLARQAGLPRPAGVYVGEVTEDSPAERAGLLARDIIVALDKQPTEKVSAFRNRISLLRPGQRVELDILRHGKKLNVHAVLGELTAELRADLERPPSDGTQSTDDLGMSVADLSAQLVQRFGLDPHTDGAVVLSVRPGSKADAAGLLPGDVIRLVGQRAVNSVADLDDAIARYAPDRDLHLQVQRGNESVQIILLQPS